MTIDDETPRQGRWRRFLGEISLALAFLSRLPTSRARYEPGALAEAAHAFPIAGLVLGGSAGLVYLVAWKLGLYPFMAALSATAFLVWLTRGLHEDGLADFADGMAGDTPEQRLAIMRDSRIGTFGVLALGLTLALRVAALAEVADPATVLKVLFAAGAASRAAMAVPLAWLPAARADGLAVTAGRPRAGTVLTGLATAVAASFLLLPWGMALVGLGVTGIVICTVGWLAERRLGGQTGDVLGTVQQVAETGFLLAAAVLLA